MGKSVARAKRQSKVILNPTSLQGNADLIGYVEIAVTHVKKDTRAGISISDS
jgi:hypothetical protein